MTTDDPWPDFSYAQELKAPGAILHEYGAILPVKTANYVALLVKPFESKYSNFGVSAFLSCPALGNYTFRILNVFYNVDMYPLEITVDDNIGEELGWPRNERNRMSSTAADQDAFRGELRKVFGSARVKKVIGALISQAKDVGVQDRDIPF